jgi:hypothetical protein
MQHSLTNKVRNCALGARRKVAFLALKKHRKVVLAALKKRTGLGKQLT